MRRFCQTPQSLCRAPVSCSTMPMSLTFPCPVAGTMSATDSMALTVITLPCGRGSDDLLESVRDLEFLGVVPGGDRVDPIDPSQDQGAAIGQTDRAQRLRHRGVRLTQAGQGAEPRNLRPWACRRAVA